MGWLVRCSEADCGWKAATSEEMEAKGCKASHESVFPSHRAIIQWMHPPDETIVVVGRGLTRSGKGQYL
jgi:hypothetical protein